MPGKNAYRQARTGNECAKAHSQHPARFGLPYIEITYSEIDKANLNP